MLRRIIGWLCILSSLALLAFAVRKYYPKFMDYKKARTLYDGIEDKYTSKPADDAPDEERPASETEFPVEEKEFGISEFETEQEYLEQTESLIFESESETETESEDVGSKKPDVDGTVSDYMRKIGKETETETEPADGIEIETEKEAKRKASSKKTKVKVIRSEAGVLRNLFREKGLKLKPSKYRSIDVDGEGLLKENKDYIGWIYVPQTDVSYPVVQGRDNNEYLHANFRKEYNYPGTIFMDSDCEKGILNHHGILYGHNMRDGSMFAQLKSWTDQKFADEHPVFWFITPKYKLLYMTFSSYVANPRDEDAFAIQGTDFKTNKEWLKILNNLKEKSAIKVDYEPNARDFTLTLSTCTPERTTRVVTTGVLLGAVMNGSSERNAGISVKKTEKVASSERATEAERGSRVG